MLKKILLSGLFAMVTLGFFIGFVSYQKEIRDALSQSIDTPSLDEGPTLVEKPTEKKTAVPRIIGLPEEEAKKLLEEAGLTPSAVTEHTDQVDKGYVFYQRPMEGAEMFEGQEVIYTVSAGPFGQGNPDEEEKKDVLLPSLLGKTQREGENILKELGLRVRVRKDYSADVAAGRVMEQEPSITAKLQPSDEVTLWVSLGAKPEETKHQVPRVVGKTRAEAERILKNAGYQVSVTEKEDADENIGKVLSQSPAGGSEVIEKGRVQLIIGNKKTVTVPETPSEGPGEEEPDPSDGSDPPVETPVNPPSVEEPEEPVETGNN
ncbi:PASTA domain-containing protein [Proteiniclasticum ruminis]|uniref:PASTA domain, binds beta-lactams n=1 Tax=Proteiniclasticum ruminis TaxID=398199 RepID=A0A1I5A178_9CLOT|nr:PASTA domain-containing protein [Proteiniclasticum ruminis]SFN56232.1 PASTA domain, binds beta-lactams [Proteiniclasticum ruminis]